MKLYNFNFWTSNNLDIVHFAQAEVASLEYDYLAPESTTITIPPTNKIKSGQFVTVTDNSEFLGIVDQVNTNKYVTTVTIQPFLMIFDQSVLVNTDWQKNGSTALENVIATLIANHWINTDGAKKVPFKLIFDITSHTTNWTMELEPDNEDGHYCICEFYDVILQQALIKYRITVKSKFDVHNRKIILYIGAPNKEITIDADTASVNIKAFTTDKLDFDFNKLTIYKEPDYDKQVTYFLHTNGEYDKNDRDRITPVKEKLMSVKEETETVTTPSTGNDDEEEEEENEDSSENKHKQVVVTKTFEEVADEKAKDEFKSLEFKNYIELDVANAPSIDFGQFCYIKHDGKLYKTILTGKKYGPVSTLMFGGIRLEFTKATQISNSSQYIVAKQGRNSSDSLTSTRG